MGRVSPDLVLGAGMTGLAAGAASGLPVYEAAADPGGICSSYYMLPGGSERLREAPGQGEAYRFEVGGGHWIFGGDPVAVRFMCELAPMRRYERRSSVYLRGLDLLVPYPLQNNLRFLGVDVAQRALAEITAPAGDAPRTMKEWVRKSFGPTLAELFFDPFHALYSAGLYATIAPQDAYKSPISVPEVVRGAFAAPAAVGYNATFLYPEEGLNTLAARMARRADVRFGMRAERIDLGARRVHFTGGESVPYRALIATLPLDRLVRMCGLDVGVPADPSTSVLVLNIGARRGPRCPRDHWIYTGETRAGFHRVGFYDNVDPSFVPKSEGAELASLYIERAYAGGQAPAEPESRAYADAVVRELQDWGYIEDVSVVDPTWIEVAYTWAWPGSRWRNRALAALEAEGVYPVGRYGRWVFQGIADSIRDGLFAGSAFRAVAG